MKYCTVYSSFFIQCVTSRPPRSHRAANEVAAGEFDESEQRWREIADEIHAEVCERGFDRDLNSFVQAYGSKRLDANLLLIPLVGFLPASDPRVQGTLRAVEDKLLIDAEFVLRYETENPGDGLAEAKVRFSLVAFGLSTITSCKGAMRRPGNYLIVCFRAVMTWVCSPKSTIRSLAACWAISRKLTVMSA